MLLSELYVIGGQFLTSGSIGHNSDIKTYFVYVNTLTRLAFYGFNKTVCI